MRQLHQIQLGGGLCRRAQLRIIHRLVLMLLANGRGGLCTPIPRRGRIAVGDLLLLELESLLSG